MEERRMFRVAGLLVAAAIGLGAPVRPEPTSRLEGVLGVAPADLHLVLVVDPPRGADPAHWPRVRDEILYGLGLQEDLQQAVALAGSAEGSLLGPLTVMARREGDGVQTAFFFRSPPDRAVAISPRSTWSAIRLDDGRHLVGDTRLVEACRDVHSGRTRGLLSDSAWRERLVTMEAEPLLGVVLPAWLGFGGDGEATSGPRQADWSVTRSLGDIRLLTLSGAGRDPVRLRLRTEVATTDAGVVLADALREFLSSLRANSDVPAVRDLLESARIEDAPPGVDLRLDLSGPAMERVRRNEASRRLLSWRLGPEERESQQRVAEVFERLGIAPGQRVADVGAGSGFFTVRLARAVGSGGEVFAVDIDEAEVARLRQRVTEAHLGNVSVIASKVDDPRLPPAGLDAVLIVNAYHEMTEHRRMLVALRTALKPGGRVLLLEPFSPKRRAESRARQTADHLLAPELAVVDLRSAGFEILSREDAFISRAEEDTKDWLVVARWP